MTIYNQLKNTLEELKLQQVSLHLDTYIELVNTKQKTMIEALYELLELEKEAKTKRTMNACVRVAGFPSRKRLEDFDFTFQPSINKEQIQQFKYLDFLDRKENIVFLGTPGVGKTHLAIAIGIEAAQMRKITYFISCQDLVNKLKQAHKENRLEKQMKVYNKYRLLIIDEVGYLPYDIEAANLLFQLISMRYEKGSIIITTNKPLSKWHEIFGDAVLANAILDRLIHHSHIINIVGRSYRMRDYINEFSEAEEDSLDAINCT